MVFILFDVEAIFLYPWAYVYRDLRWYGFIEMLVYMAILLAGYVYLWKKGALDWSNKPPPQKIRTMSDRGVKTGSDCPRAAGLGPMRSPR